MKASRPCRRHVEQDGLAAQQYAPSLAPVEQIRVCAGALRSTCLPPRRLHEQQPRRVQRVDTSTKQPNNRYAIKVTSGVAAAAHRLITKDWAATIVGLALLLLTLAGVIGKGMVP